MKDLLEISSKEGTIDPGERAMLRDIVDLGRLRVRDVMTPRVEMIALPTSATRTDVQATLGPLTLTQTLNVALGAPGRTLFLWPSNFDIAAATHPPQALAQGPQADH